MKLPRRMRDDIASCDDFLCLVDTHWAASPTARAQLAYARELGKPVIALIRSGLTLPPALLILLADTERHYFSTPEDLQLIRAMLDQRTGGSALVEGGVND